MLSSFSAGTLGAGDRHTDTAAAAKGVGERPKRTAERRKASQQIHPDRAAVDRNFCSVWCRVFLPSFCDVFANKKQRSKTERFEKGERLFPIFCFRSLPHSSLHPFEGVLQRSILHHLAAFVSLVAVCCRFDYAFTCTLMSAPISRDKNTARAIPPKVEAKKVPCNLYRSS